MDDSTLLLDIISKHMNISLESILSTYRGRKQSDARKVFCGIMRRHLDCKWKPMSNYLNRKSHWASCHSYRRSEDLYESDEQFRKDYDFIEKRFLELR